MFDVEDYSDDLYIITNGQCKGNKIPKSEFVNFYIPKPGYKIIVPSSYYTFRGEDDFEGGLATIKNVHISKDLPIYHVNAVMVEIEQRPNTNYNWKKLLCELEKNEKIYGNSIAHKNPDYRREFNNDIEGWN